MILSISIFLIIFLIFIINVIGSWLYTRHTLKNKFLSFKNLDETLIQKYNLIDYSLIDKNSTWIDLSIWNVVLFLLSYSILFLFPFLIFKNENQTLFIASIILIILGNVICLVINFVISFLLWKKNYTKNKEQIEINKNEFISKLPLYKEVEVNQFIKTDVYNFRNKIYQKHFNKALSKIKFKSTNQWNIRHYVIFLKYAHFFIFNLINSNIQYTNSDFLIICDQTLNNLMVKINNHYSD